MSVKPVITYVYSLPVSPGALTAKNHISLFNPVGSGKVLVLGEFLLAWTLTNPSTAILPMRGFRTTAASGGTLVPSADVCKFNNTHPDPVGVIRIDDPACTLGAAIFNSPPGLVNRSSETHHVEIPHLVGGRFIVKPGEGVVLRQGASVTELFWNLSVVWTEGDQ